MPNQFKDLDAYWYALEFWLINEGPVRTISICWITSETPTYFSHAFGGLGGFNPQNQIRLTSI